MDAAASGGGRSRIAGVAIGLFVERIAGVPFDPFEVDLALKHKVATVRKLAMVYNGLADVGREGRADVLTNPPRLVMTARMAEGAGTLRVLLHSLAFGALKPLAGAQEVLARLALEVYERVRAEILGNDALLIE